MNLGQQRATERPAGLPGRLRSFFGPGRAKRPEPRVRYGQFFLPGLAVLGRPQANEARPLLDQAHAVRTRRFTYLGRTLVFPARIDWEPTGLSERWRIKLNSLDELLALGVAAALVSDPHARQGWYDVAAGLMREWVEGASERGVGWGVPALAARIPNLIYAQVLFAAELRADLATRRLLIESLDAQAAELAIAVEDQPSDVALIDAGRALFMAGRFFDAMEARGWLETGAAILWEQLREQVHEDGGHRDRTPARHAHVLATYIEFFALLQASRDELPMWARKRVKGMADLLVRILHPDGQVPLFHGTALGMVRPPELLAAAAVVLHEPDLAPPGDLPGVWPLLILGEAGRRVHVNLARRRPASEPRALRRVGFYVLPGEAGDVLLLDGESPPPDGDGNVFGYELSVGGQRLIVDSGDGGEEAEPWRTYFRSARAHNVMIIKGAEQVVDGRVPLVGDVEWIVKDGLRCFAGTHDGFAGLSEDLSLRHRRRIFCLPGRFWLVCDEVLGTGVWQAESFLHFHPEIVLSGAYRTGPTFMAERSRSARVQVVPGGAAKVRAVHGLVEPNCQGWYAGSVGERRSATVMSFVKSAEAPFVFGYALLPRTNGPAVLRFEHDAFHFVATLVTEGDEYRIRAEQGDLELTTRSV
ncbi:MAG TPA: alginate lyase family protein [Candidatus Nitrosopolaris sp.]|nr:alginate lyase family protein [Candidatus Nitrosopolaris sp.]